MKRSIYGLLALLALVVLPVLAQESNVQIIGGDEDALREFVLRYLGAGGAYTEDTTILIGALPDELPFDLPLPNDAQIVGSIVRSDSHSIEIIADSALEPDAVVAFFDDALADGWESAQGGMMPVGGFVENPFTMGQFCYNEGEAALNINASSAPSGMTDIRFYIISPGDAYMCAGGSEMAVQDAFRLLPRLTTPEGVELLPGSGGGGGGGFPGRRSASSTANLTTERPLQDIADDYNAQLVDAGWEQSDSAVSGGVAWSGWTFTDETGARWGGTFTITASPTDDGEYAAWLMIQEAD